MAHDLSHIRYTDGKTHRDDVVAIVVSKWNPDVTEALFTGAVDVLLAAGVSFDNILRYNVPGSYELPTGAMFAIEKNMEDDPVDGVICLGCVIQGETRHFDFICQAVADGVMRVGLDYNIPAIFGVLTTNTNEQALERAGGKLGNKGCEAAVALLEMIDLQRL